ncbi:Cytochrome P450 86A1 [Glycine soja]
MPLITDLSSSLSILIVLNSYLFADNQFSLTVLANILRYHVLLQFLSCHATNNFGFVNVTCDSQFGVISIRSPTSYSPSNVTILSFIKKCDNAKKSLSVTALRQIVLNFFLVGRDTSLMALTWFFWFIINHLAVEEKIHTELMAVFTSTCDDDQWH